MDDRAGKPTQDKATQEQILQFIVPVVFDPNPPHKAYRDKPWDIWRFTLGLLVVQLGTLVASTFKRGTREPDEPVTLKLSP